ncbi:MAG: polysulfide reductase NrfD [Firmicutes bacterium]|nr:polysulfide reductase NrfD [Bacillota bacterium]MCL5039764.1 polysulfide reductase NrfD [Bacillota bacterium]
MRRIFYLVIGLLTAGGLGLLIQRLTWGLAVTRLTSAVPWGLWIAIYIYFVGLSAGSFLLSTLIYVFGLKQLERVGRLSLLAAIVSLFGAMLFVLIDLGHPERALQMIFSWHVTSVMAWEFLFYIAYIFLMVAELWYLMRDDLYRASQTEGGIRGTLARVLTFGYRQPADAAAAAATDQKAHSIVKVLGILGLPLAIGVHGGTGAIFGVVAARPYWNSGLFPILFIVSALASGAALITFLFALLGRRDGEYLSILQRLAGLMILFISLDALLLSAEFLVHLYRGMESHSAQYQLLFGRYALLFWGGEVGFGMVLPTLIVAFRRNSAAWLGGAGLSMLLGIVAVRFNIVVPAYWEPMLKGLDRAVTDPRFSFLYTPGVLEAGLTIGMIAMMVLAFALAVEALPFYELAPGQSKAGVKSGIKVTAGL